ncbi:Sel1 domain-containing protein [Arcobacter acticola]|uniref:beta-lactamase n=1 Tax=Arcobacter acticola TaxID=1849015 RepID=A0A6M8ESP9_9BACT|nr:tetratricopeptide repeat protein [Arcobacter acticola]QKE27565.1 Sel1 domain-containing protein [Arcobacter acticola]
MKLTAYILLFITTLYGVTFDEATENFNKKNYIEAYEQYSQLALDDDANAQYNIALMNYKGIGVTKNNKLAFFWYEKSALNGNSAAQNNLAHMYFLGEEVKKDLVLAEKWYKLSAEANYPLAQLNLAMMYDSSTSEEKVKEAFAWYTKASL